MFGNQLTFPTFCPLITCVAVMPSQATCHSLNISWFSDAPLYFASSILLSCISLYFHLYLLNPPKPLWFNSDAFSFNEDSSRSSQSDLWDQLMSLSQHSVCASVITLITFGCMLQLVMTFCLFTNCQGLQGRICFRLIIIPHGNYAHTHLKIYNHSSVVYFLISFLILWCIWIFAYCY